MANVFLKEQHRDYINVEQHNKMVTDSEQSKEASKTDIKLGGKTTKEYDIVNEYDAYKGAKGMYKKYKLRETNRKALTNKITPTFEKANVRYTAIELELECPRCRKQFDTKTGLLNHIRVHQTVRTFTCMLCQAIFKSNVELIAHKKFHKKEDCVFSCKWCEKIFNDHQDWLIHSVSHIKRPYYKCAECDRYFKIKGHYIAHIQSHYNREAQCKVCQKVFKSLTTLSVHIRLHTSSFECGECGKICKEERAYKCHMMSHTGVKPYQCWYCGKGFGNTAQRKIHMYIHTGEKRFECNLCGHKSHQQTDLKRHIETHATDKTYECDHCQKKFMHKESLKYHIRIHMNFKPYPCEKCDKRFTTMINLKSHLLYKHIKPGSFKCNICEVKFHTKSHLKRHMQSKRHKNNVYGISINKKI